MKKITILALHLNYGGVEQYISSLCKMLEADYKIELIVTYNNNDKPAFEFSDKITIKYLINDMPNKEKLKLAIKNKKIVSIIKEGIKSIKILYLKRRKNIEIIKKINSDYIITTREFHNKLVSKYAKKNIIKIATEHNFHNNDKKYVNKLVKSLSNFNVLVTVSKELEDYYKELLDIKVIYIPNVIDKLPGKVSNLKSSNFVSIGRLSKEKGFSDLIDVFEKISKKKKSSKLYIIGDGVERENLEEKVKLKNLEDRIIFTGFLNKKEMEKYILDSRIYLMTSFTESFGLVLIEAMGYGIPCVAFDSASGPRCLINSKNGLLVKDRNIDLMANEVVKLYDDEERMKKLSIGSITTSKMFLGENVKKEWLKLLK